MKGPMLFDGGKTTPTYSFTIAWSNIRVARLNLQQEYLAAPIFFHHAMAASTFSTNVLQASSLFGF